MTIDPTTVYRDADSLDWLIRELRSDQAGETGAVWIYRGILAVSRDPEVIRFAEHHRATEEAHLDTINELLPRSDRSLLLVLWRVSGFVLGAVPAILGREAVFQTIEAVETFVESHYQDQIDRLEADGKADIAAILRGCMEDEVRHRDEAAAGRTRPPGFTGRLWQKVIGAGSAGAVVLARRI